MRRCLCLLFFWAPAVAASLPGLVLCVCNTTLATTSVVSSTASSTQTAKYVLPSCVSDVFATSGIRWYINGPVLSDITYWQNDPVSYDTGRAAKRLIALGYRCSLTQLYDASSSS